MSWSDRRTEGPPKRMALAPFVTAMCVLAGLGVGIATGSVALMVTAFAVVVGAGLLPAVMDWRASRAAVEAIRQQNKKHTGIKPPEGCVETQTPGPEEAKARITAYYARLAREPDAGSGRFQERVAVQQQAVRDRGH
jgi:hypothetical protein